VILEKLAMVISRQLQSAANIRLFVVMIFGWHGDRFSACKKVCSEYSGEASKKHPPKVLDWPIENLSVAASI